MAAKKAKAKKPEPQTHIQSLQGTKAEKLQTLYDQWVGCKKCELHSWRCSKFGEPSDDIVFCSGNPDAPVMIIGEAPGEEESQMLVPFVGRSGKLLNQILAATASDKNIQALLAWYTKVAHTAANEKKFHDEMFVWREQNFFLANVVSCRPPENRAPTPPEIEACMPRLLNVIYAADPRVIIVAGATASKALTERRSIQITSRRGELFEIQFRGIAGQVAYPAILTLHPSYLLRKADWNIPGGEYSKVVGDFSKALKIANFLKEKQDSNQSNEKL